MTKPLEMLTVDEARAANEIILEQVVIYGDDVSWDWTLRSLARAQPLAVSAYRSTLSEPDENLETAVNFTLRKVGLQLEGSPVQVPRPDGLFSLRYRVGRHDSTA